MEQQLRGISSTYLKTRKEAKQIAQTFSIMREQSVRTQRHITLDEIGRRIALGQFKELNVKGDVDGSVALSDSFSKLSTKKFKLILFIKVLEQLQKLMLC
jgi:translation initiation factor IF-2